MAQDAAGFRISPTKGFHIIFENGCTVSVQFGGGNYCGNYNAPIGSDPVPHSATAEVAAWGANGDWIKFPDWEDDVAGYQTPAQVLSFMAHVASLPAKLETAA